MSSEEPSPKADIAIDLVANLAAAGAGLAVGGVSGALTAAASAPIASDVLRRIRTRREEKVDAVIKFAAKRAGISADSLIERLEQGSESEQLFVRTVQAAQDKAEISHLMALGESLAAADRSGYSLDRLTFETAFVRAMAECDTSHVRLLRAFTTAYDDLRLDQYREWRAQPLERDGDLDSTQLEAARQRLELGDTLDYLLATLERVGLIRTEVVGEPAPPMMSRTKPLRRITDFGKAFLERMDLIQQITT